jgi:hypothetical protein
VQKLRQQTSCAIQDGKAQIASVVLDILTTCALPSGSLKRPPQMVYYLVLLRKEFKVNPENLIRCLGDGPIHAESKESKSY